MNVAVQLLSVLLQPIRDKEDTILFYKALTSLTIQFNRVVARSEYLWLRC